MNSAEGNAPNLHRLTTQRYWDRTWGRVTDGHKRARRLKRLESFDRQVARLLLDAVARARPAHTRPRVLEVGCANSIWLPYLARETDGQVVGVDFSEQGCRLAEQNLAAMGVKGAVICDDFFTFAATAQGSFDVILSFGFIEHFADVTAVLSKMVGLLRPGGVLVATVPNLAGVYGGLQRRFDRRVFEQHVTLRVDAIADHGRRAGLMEVESGYVGGALRLSVLNFAHIAWLPPLLSRLVARGLFEVDCVVAAALRNVGDHGNRPGTAPYVFVRGVRPQL